MVIDTMVFAYALLHEPQFAEESTLILSLAKEIVVPDLFRAEFLNVLWLWVRHRRVSSNLAFEILQDAEALITEIASTLSLRERAFELAVQTRHSPYDTLFVALAELRHCQVVSYDRKLQKVFPDWVIAPSNFIKLHSH